MKSSNSETRHGSNTISAKSFKNITPSFQNTERMQWPSAPYFTSHSHQKELLSLLFEEGGREEKGRCQEEKEMRRNLRSNRREGMTADGKGKGH